MLHIIEKSQVECLRMQSSKPESSGPLFHAGGVKPPPIDVKKQIPNYFVSNKGIHSLFPLLQVTRGKLMGSMQIKDGIWFFSVDLKGEVKRSRGGMAIITTHLKAASISMYFTSLALRVGRKIREHKGVAELLKERN